MAPPTCCAFSDDIDWGILGGPSQEAEAPRTAPRGGEPGGATGGATGGGEDDESDEDGFTVFDGFGTDFKPTKVRAHPSPNPNPNPHPNPSPSPSPSPNPSPDHRWLRRGALSHRAQARH